MSRRPQFEQHFLRPRTSAQQRRGLVISWENLENRSVPSGLGNLPLSTLTSAVSSTTSLVDKVAPLSVLGDLPATVVPPADLNVGALGSGCCKPARCTRRVEQAADQRPNRLDGHGRWPSGGRSTRCVDGTCNRRTRRYHGECRAVTASSKCWRQWRRSRRRRCWRSCRNRGERGWVGKQCRRWRSRRCFRTRVDGRLDLNRRYCRGGSQRSRRIVGVRRGKLRAECAFRSNEPQLVRQPRRRRDLASECDLSGQRAAGADLVDQLVCRGRGSRVP